MSGNPDNDKETITPQKISLAEKAKVARKEQYQKAKEKQKAYLATPEVQKRLSERKMKLQKMRSERADQFRAKKKRLNAAAKKALSDDASAAREKRQAERDLELKEKVRPALTLIQGGAEF